MNIQDVLNNILELGFISYSNDKINKRIPILTPPKFNVHKERVLLFLQYLNDYLNYHAKNNTVVDLCYYFTLYDAWREHAEPSSTPMFIDSTPELLELYKGKGSAGEPGRFIQPPSMKDIFPIFNHKVLAFGRHKNDAYTVMIPDTDFIKTRGYVELKSEIDKEDIKWEDKIDKIFWRGGCHGFGYQEYDPVIKRCQRQMLIDYSSFQKSISKDTRTWTRHSFGTNSGAPHERQPEDWIDAKSSYSSPKSEFLKYKYQIDIDGEVNAWSALWWKLYCNSVVFKVNSHYEQWYYKDLKEWIHYIPVKADLSDLEEKYQWALHNDEKCKRIAENGREFIKGLTYEYVISNYKI